MLYPSATSPSLTHFRYLIVRFIFCVCPHTHSPASALVLVLLPIEPVGLVVSEPYRAGVTGSCEPPDIAAGNLTQVLWKIKQ